MLRKQYMVAPKLRGSSVASKPPSKHKAADDIQDLARRQTEAEYKLDQAIAMQTIAKHQERAEHECLVGSRCAKSLLLYVAVYVGDCARERHIALVLCSIDATRR